MDQAVIELLQAVIAREPKRRAEAEWIGRQAARAAQRAGIASRAALDEWIFGQMYHRAAGAGDVTKIRYWRTGRHLPASRAEALAFAGALGLSEEETVYFLQACMEKSDVVYETPPQPGEAGYETYARRRALMEEMIGEYIAQIPPARIIQMDIPYERLGAYARHLFCLDALSATALGAQVRGETVGNHLSSNNYESEFLRVRALVGEIPRRTMLRQILLMGMPYLNRRVVDARLAGFGYLPLTPGHASARGALVDDVVIGLLDVYQDRCRGQDPVDCRRWLLAQWRGMDEYLAAQGLERYRLMVFRVLATMAGV